MDKFIIKGGNKLQGEIEASGSKNSALPILTAAILSEEGLILHNSPNKLSDIKSQLALLESLGMETKVGYNKVDLKMSKGTNFLAPYEIVRKMRTSILILGPMLARFGQISISLPGGCAIGARPINLHLEALAKMKADIKLEHGNIIATAKEGLVGTEIDFGKVSVGATENIMMAACLAKGRTIISNAAREPEIVDLGKCLIKMGANIEGLGTQRIVVIGRKSLKRITHKIISDRIEVGSFIFCVAATKGQIKITGTNPEHLTKVIEVARQIGINVVIDGTSLLVEAESSKKLKPLKMSTHEYPGFPTDLQAQLMSALLKADGISVIRENIFENRFMHVPELVRFGADISINNRTSTIIGVNKLSGAEVLATDLRASMSLIIAGLVAKGQSIVNRIYHIDRGYENVETKLQKLGANIIRVKD